MEILVMEDRVRALEIANAQLATSVEHLSRTVDTLATTVQTLRDTMNQGRGALWLMMGAAGSLGAIVVTLAKKLMGLG
jgi:NADPH-dependent curcumin reductase CurA